VNDLPLSIVLSWYEQKAVALLLTLPLGPKLELGNEGNLFPHRKKTSRPFSAETMSQDEGGGALAAPPLTPFLKVFL
jgi:hypothetical protein